MRENIGFIGLGLLGAPVAANLLQAGYALTVYNRSPEKAEPLVARGALQAVRPADTVTTGGIVVTLVWDDKALEDVVKSEDFLERLGIGGIHVSMSTGRRIRAGSWRICMRNMAPSMLRRLSLDGQRRPLPGNCGFQ